LGFGARGWAEESRNFGFRTCHGVAESEAGFRIFHRPRKEAHRSGKLTQIRPSAEISDLAAQWGAGIRKR
jgi:hypothetical protein